MGQGSLYKIHWRLRLLFVHVMFPNGKILGTLILGPLLKLNMPSPPGINKVILRNEKTQPQGPG